MNEKSIELAAPAKINLYLQVTGRRGDGYHFLATLMQKITLSDRLVLRPVPSGITVSCPGSELPTDENNLVHRAARLFQQTLVSRLGRDYGVHITLEKNIPIAAGLGGGSSDAAAVLRGLDALFSTACTQEELMRMGRQLGADVPLFLVDWPVAWATGIGDILHPAVPLAGYVLVLVTPGISVSTPWVYRKYALTAAEKKINLKNFSNTASAAACDHAFTSRSIRPDELMNDLEQVTAAFYPEVARLKEKLLRSGAVAAMMSGSGPTVFGLFPETAKEKTAACLEELQRDYQKVFLVHPLKN